MAFNTLLKHVTMWMFGILLIGGAQLLAQTSFPMQSNTPFVEIDRKIVDDYHKSPRLQGISTEANLSLFLDFDRMAGNDRGFRWNMNSLFAADFDLNYAILAVDTLLDTTGIGYAIEDHIITVDSVDIIFNHVNASGMNNMIVTSIVGVGPTGLPNTNVMFADTLQSDSSLTGAGFGIYTVFPNVQFCGEGFAVRLDFFGPTTDTLSIIGGFRDACAGACQAARSSLYANSYYFLNLPQINYAQESPDSLGQGIFFDCNMNSMADLDSTGCEDFPLQEFLFYPYVTINDIPNSTATVTDENCASASGAINATPAGGSAPFTYSWSNGATTEDLSGLIAGTYTLTVTDASGCGGSATYTVNSTNVPPMVATTVVNANCGVSDGSATATPSSGTAPYTYSWNTSPSQTTQTATGISAGTYMVTVTDANGCFADLSVSVGNIGGPTLTNAPSTNVTCSGAGDGTAAANVTGGTAPYTYAWSNGGSTQMISNLGPGTYTFTVTDNAGCLLTGSATVTEPTAITVSSLTSTNASCNGLADGTVTLGGAMGGTAPLSYAWSNGATTPNLTAVGAGTYGVVITDANGCTFQSGTATVTEPAAIMLNISTTQDNGGATGSATATVVGGGSSNFNYMWSTGQSGMGLVFIAGLSKGVYTVTVTDPNGCAVTDTFTIDGPIGIEDQLAAGVSQLNLYPNPSSGLFTLSVELMERDDVLIRVFDLRGRQVTHQRINDTNDIQTTFDLTNQPAGIYTLQVTTSVGSASQKVVKE